MARTTCHSSPMPVRSYNLWSRTVSLLEPCLLAIPFSQRNIGRSSESEKLSEPQTPELVSSEYVILISDIHYTKFPCLLERSSPIFQGGARTECDCPESEKPEAKEELKSFEVRLPIFPRNETREFQIASETLRSALSVVEAKTNILPSTPSLLQSITQPARQFSTVLTP
jgi:hypothetical protein